MELPDAYTCKPPALPRRSTTQMLIMRVTICLKPGTLACRVASFVRYIHSIWAVSLYYIPIYVESYLLKGIFSTYIENIFNHSE